MERKINLEEIIQKETDFVSKSNEQVYNIQDIKLCMKEFGKQLLELAAENAKTREMTELWSGQVWDDGPLPICIDKQSILDTINQVE